MRRTGDVTGYKFATTERLHNYHQSAARIYPKTRLSYRFNSWRKNQAGPMFSLVGGEYVDLASIAKGGILIAVIFSGIILSGIIPGNPLFHSSNSPVYLTTKNGNDPTTPIQKYSAPNANLQQFNTAGAVSYSSACKFFPGPTQNCMLLQSSQNAGNNNWASTNAIPTTGAYSCVMTGFSGQGYIYCLDAHGHAYFDTSGPSGLGGAWSSGTSYIVSAGAPPACVVNNSYETCVGGNATSTLVKYSLLSAAGWGTWTTTTPYPIGILDESCITSLGRIYCVSGVTGASLIANNTYYGSLTNGAVSSWTQSTSYPVSDYDQVCVVTGASATTMICAGGSAYAVRPGLTCCSSLSANSYSATLSGSGISNWSANAWMPQGMDFGSCVGLTVYDYCIGGRADCSPLGCTSPGTFQNDTIFTSPSIFPNWQTNVNWFPTPAAYGIGGCATDGTDIFCVGGYVGPNNFSTTTTAVWYVNTKPLIQSITWNRQTTSIIGNTVEACGIDSISSTIYCVGQNLQTEFASVSNTGVIGTWGVSTSYPFVAGVTNFDTAPPSVVVTGGYIYAIGGYCVTSCNGPNFNAGNGVFSAPVSSSGIGAWTQQGNYPTNIYGTSCGTFQNYLYCVGGAPSGTSYSSATYAASISAGFVGTWQTGTAYPTTIYGAGCAIQGTTMYCTSGLGSTGGLHATANSFSSPLSTSAPYLGTWTQTTNYPVGKTGNGLFNVNCVFNGVKIYCLGGDWWSIDNHNEGGSSLVFSSIDGMTTWTRESNLPYSTMYFYTGGISDNNGIIYTVGGTLFEQDSPGSFMFTQQVWSTSFPSTVSSRPAIAETLNPIGDLSPLVGKELEMAAFWTTTNNNSVTPGCANGGCSWGYFLSVNASVWQTSNPNYNPRTDPTVALFVETYLVSGTTNHYTSILWIQQKIGETIASEDSNCSGSSYLCSTGTLSDLGTRGARSWIQLNYTGVSNQTQVGGTNNCPTGGLIGGPSCSYLQIDDFGGKVGNEYYQVANPNSPQFPIAGPSYYLGFWVSAGQTGVGIYYCFDTGASCGATQTLITAGCATASLEIDYCVPDALPTTATCPSNNPCFINGVYVAGTTDSGGFFGSVGRFLGGVGSAITGGAVGLFNTINPGNILGGALGQIGNALLSAIEAAFGAMAIALVGALNYIGNAVGLGNVGSSLAGFFGGIGSFITGVLGTIAGDIGSFASFIASGLSAVGNVSGTFFTQTGLALSTLSNLLSGAWGVIQSVGFWFKVGLSGTLFVILIIGAVMAFEDYNKWKLEWWNPMELFMLKLFLGLYWVFEKGFDLLWRGLQSLKGWL